MKKIAIHGVYETLSIFPNRIFGLEADDKYSHFIILDDKEEKRFRRVTSSLPLKHYQVQLREDGIVRANKSQMINLLFVNGINNEHLLLLEHDYMGNVYLTKDFREEFFAQHKA
jgi:hypothetical protein